MLLVCNVIIRQTEAGGLRVTGQPGLYIKIISQKWKRSEKQRKRRNKVVGGKMDGRKWRNQDELGGK